MQKNSKGITRVGAGLLLSCILFAVSARADNDCITVYSRCEKNPCTPECEKDFNTCSGPTDEIKEKAERLATACNACEEQFISTEGDEAVPQRKEVDKCCVCQYQDIPECKNRKAADCESPVKTLEVPKGQQECLWYGPSWTFMQCVSTGNVICEQWKAAKVASGECDEKTSFIVDRDVPVLEGYQCKKTIRSRYAGHGRGCEGLAGHMKVCIKAAGPNCEEITHEEKSCSTFKNKKEANQFAIELQARLKLNAATEKLKVNVTANQAMAGWRELPWAAPDGTTIVYVCETPLRYIITCKDIKKTAAAPCHQEKRSKCVKASDSDGVLCRDESGKDVDERCCLFCSSSLFSRRRQVDTIERLWTRGRECNTECNGYCSGYANSIGFTTAYACGDAKESAEAQVKSCLDEIKKQCERPGSEGKFSTSNPSSTKVAEGWVSCTYSAQENWECKEKES